MRGTLPPDSPIDAKVAALREPSAYPAAPAAVEVIETHMSWVFLAGPYVYKLKKPVRYDGIDCSLIEARRSLCLEELRLNRRLAPTVYLDVVPLRAGAGGALRIDGEGAVADWLVWMRRLPADLMLDRMVGEGRANAAHMGRIAGHLAGFYRQLAPAVSDAGRFLAGLRRQVDGCERELCDPAYGLAVGGVQDVCRRLRAALADRRELFEARVAAGRVIEGHGDLRPEHIWVGEPVAIIDCLEFSAALRTLDSADELGFLALECERLGAPQLGNALFDAYAGACGDVPEPALVGFYQAFRGCVRATIAIRHLQEERYRGSPKWASRARQYLGLAARHLEGPAPSLA